MSLVEVRYKGLSDIREISQEDWHKQGVAMPKDTVWDRSNRWTLLIDGTDRMLEVLAAQGHFQVLEVTDSNQTREIIAASDPAREADIVVDGTTGQREVNKRKGQAALAPKDEAPKGDA